MAILLMLCYLSALKLPVHYLSTTLLTSLGTNKLKSQLVILCLVSQNIVLPPPLPSESGFSYKQLALKTYWYHN